MDNKSSSGGMDFGSVLTLIFIVLKLTGVIDWSWLWVLSPIWITLILVALCVIAYLLLEHHTEKKERRDRWKF